MAETYAGIAWTGEGYEVEVLDGAGRRVVEPSGWSGAQTAELIAWLRDFDGGRAPAVVLDSTNGLLDGPMTAAGLEVYRADPWLLPPRPGFGSVPAARLAERARTAPGELARVTAEGGTLTGRAEEYFAEREARRAGRRGTDRGRTVLRARPPGRPEGRAHLRRRPRPGLHPPGAGHPGALRSPGDLLLRRAPRRGAARPRTPDRRRFYHELGNHSWSHPYLPDLTPEQLREQLDRTAEAVAKVTGEDAPTRFRPPYGALSPEVLAALEGYPTTLTMWDVDTRDWARPGAERIAATVLESAEPGSVVLMHEGAGDRAQTVEALPAIVEGLLARGLELVTVGELAAPPGTDGPPPSAR